jgi:rhodanese-related sulfurtransferase
MIVGRICVVKVHDLTPEEVSKGMAEGRYLLVDVREPNEVAVEAYPDGVVVPLSSCEPFRIRKVSRWSLPAARASAP